MGWTETIEVYDEEEFKFASADIHEKLYQDRGAYEPIFQKMFAFKREPLDSYKEAEEFLRYSPEAERYYRKYDTAVRFLDYSDVTPTKKMLDLKHRLDETVQKKADYAEKHSVKNFKADFVGCPGCGSKIARRFIHADKCPLCHKDLRSETTIKTIKGYDEKIKELGKMYDEAEKKNKKKAKVMWAVYAQAYLG